MDFFRGCGALLLLMPAALGCGNAQCEAPEVPDFSLRFEDPQEDLPDFGAHPWPSDALKAPSGRLRLDHFPNPTESSTLEDYLRVISQETSAYAISAAGYLAFSEPLDVGSLPADALASLQADSSVSLINIDVDSPSRGRRIPLRLRASKQAGLHLPENHLIARPVYGSGMKSDTTYALVLSPSVQASSGTGLKRHPRLNDALSKDCEDSVSAQLFAAFEPLRRYIEDGLISESDIAGATVYTTQPVVQEIREIGAAARIQPAPEVKNWAFEGGDASTYRLRAEIDLPSFQSGERPYRAQGDGGGFARDGDGHLAVDHHERTRIGIAIPQSGTMPANGWPVALYSHGTGGDYASGLSQSVAGNLARNGIAVIGYDQTLHGPRDPTGSDPELTFFNLFNPIAARDNLRQGTADLVVMTNLIEALRIPPAQTAGRGEVYFDARRISFVGHSQGALVGAPFAAVDERIKGHVFSGLGAVLTVTLLERKDERDFEALLRTLIGYPDDAQLDDMDPVLNMIQTFIEPADPIAYAASYLTDPPQGFRSDMLQVEGFLDAASPARGQEAFATAAGLAVISPVHRIPFAAELLGPEPQSAPAHKNVESAAGPATFGLIQYPDQGHFPIFQDADANRRFIEFVRSSLLEDRATIVE